MTRKRNDIALTKAVIRTRILVRLKTQKEDERTRKSACIAKKLFRTRVFMRAKIIMFYKAFKGEVDTDIMIKAAQKLGKIVVVPVCGENRTMIPCILKEGSRLLRGPYGIGEPAVKKSVSSRPLTWSLSRAWRLRKTVSVWVGEKDTTTVFYHICLNTLPLSAWALISRCLPIFPPMPWTLVSTRSSLPDFSGEADYCTRIIKIEEV